jgi:hemerythrin superfamily protein
MRGTDRAPPHSGREEHTKKEARMKATEMLKKQHREVARLFGQALRSEDPDQKKQLVGEIVEKLSLHATIEEEIFYPAFREGAGTQKAEDSVLEAYEEHHVMKVLLGEVEKLDASAENFDAKLTVLKEIVEHHVEEEEQEMFPSAEKKLGKERLDELAQEMQAAAGAPPARGGRRGGASVSVN